jgi:hypothetical protein
MQDINFGRVERVRVHDGQPVIGSDAKIERVIKISGKNGSRQERMVDEFRLKLEVLELLTFMRQLGNGVIDVIEIRYGLPFQIRVRGNAA